VYLLLTGLLQFRTRTVRLQRFACRVDRFHSSGFAPAPDPALLESDVRDD
jgi:hypothetical protein